MEEKPNYYAIIPANVRYDNELRANEKLLYGEITTLTQKTGECWANNKYFAELYDVKENAIATWIKHLKEKQYISVDYLYNGKEITKRIIRIGGIQKDSTWYSKRDEGGIQKEEDNNTSINNTSIKKNIKKKYGEFENVILTDEEHKKIQEQHLETYINKLSIYISSTGKTYKSHYATILNWKRREDEKKETIKQKSIPEWFKKDIKENEATEEEIKELERKIRC